MSAADVLLIIEVAGTSLRYDREVKVPLYARHGIAEVWLIDIETRTLTRYRQPREGAYAQTDTPEGREPIPVAALGDWRLDLGAVLAG